MTYAADLQAIREAYERIAPLVHRTPVHTSRTLSAMAGCELFFKCENFQRVGAFKFRGACNALARLPDEVAERGVVTHSSGNHAQAVALAARIRGVQAHIVMPATAPPVKRRAVAGYGAAITTCAPTLEARHQRAAEVLDRTGGALIPPYDHPDVIAGQGTVALELLEQVPDLDAIVAPVGGGGLVSGMALYAREAAPSVRVWAAEPVGADDAARSRAAGELLPPSAPNTVADGLLTGLGTHTWPVVRDVVAGVLVVDDEQIVAAMRLVWERMKLVIEPSAAVALAAVLAHGAGGAQRVGIVLSGGNVDIDANPLCTSV